MKMRRSIFLAILGFASCAMASPSILDIQRSISDKNIIPPESFETKTRELEESFYMRNYTVQTENSAVKIGNDKEYEQLLSQLPTIIEMPYNPIVGKFIDMYLGKRRGLVADMLALHKFYGKFFVEALEKEKVPLELQYLPVIESAINPNAVSRAGATGLWQFMPGTATGLGMEVNSLVDQRRDPVVSSKYAAKFLKQLYGIYGDWSLAIAAYNCGPGNVNKALRRAGAKGEKLDFWEIYNYLPAETRGYVPAFIAANFVMNYYHKYGIKPTLVKHVLVTDTVMVSDRIHFNQIADVLEIPVDEIRMLNPQYRKDIIPGDNHPYALTLPSQQCLSFIMSRDSILAHDADIYNRRTHVEIGRRLSDGVEKVSSGDDNNNSLAQQTKNADSDQIIATDITQPVKKITHVVGRGENLRDIAKKYEVSATDIKRWNQLRRGKVKEGDKLIIEVYSRELANASTTNPTKNDIAEAKQEQEKAAATQAEAAAATKPATPKREQSAKAAEQKKESKPKTTTYIVKSGDTLEKIAKRNGVTVDELRKANGMAKGQDKIKINQKLVVPSKGGKSTGSRGKRRRR